MLAFYKIVTEKNEISVDGLRDDDGALEEARVIDDGGEKVTAIVRNGQPWLSGDALEDALHPSFPII